MVGCGDSVSVSVPKLLTRRPTISATQVNRGVAAMVRAPRRSKPVEYPPTVYPRFMFQGTAPGLKGPVNSDFPAAGPGPSKSSDRPVGVRTSAPTASPPAELRIRLYFARIAISPTPDADANAVACGKARPR